MKKVVKKPLMNRTVKATAKGSEIAVDYADLAQMTVQMDAIRRTFEKLSREYKVYTVNDPIDLIPPAIIEEDPLP